VAVPKYEPREAAVPPTPCSTSAAAKGTRTIWMAGAMADATLYERDRLDIDAEVIGPAIVEQFDATTVIPPRWTGRVDGFGNLILQRA
jgi:N-methylhydantoinase A